MNPRLTLVPIIKDSTTGQCTGLKISPKSLFAKEGKALPWKLMFDIEIGEVYSVNQELDIGRSCL